MSPVVASAPQHQEQQQDKRHHADSHDGDVPLPPPLVSMAQFPPPQVSVLTALPHEANNAAVAAHKQRSAVSPTRKRLYFSDAVFSCLSISARPDPAFWKHMGNPSGVSWKHSALQADAARTSPMVCLHTASRRHCRTLIKDQLLLG